VGAGIRGRSRKTSVLDRIRPRAQALGLFVRARGAAMDCDQLAHGIA
jgi:hypothetical protein